MNYKFYLVFQQKRLTLGERQAMCEQLVKEKKKTETWQDHLCYKDTLKASLQQKHFGTGGYSCPIKVLLVSSKNDWNSLTRSMKYLWNPGKK